MNRATKSMAGTAKEILMVPEVAITGPWEITVNGVKLNVTEPQVVRVIERHTTICPSIARPAAGRAADGMTASRCAASRESAVRRRWLSIRIPSVCASPTVPKCAAE
ncbi:MAG: hypothetical protein IJS15_05670 [Victivallales bacterium]|nr:hypothetical protein [Victivallales bacterium]